MGDAMSGAATPPADHHYLSKFHPLLRLIHPGNLSDGPFFIRIPKILD